ncbi:MAG TPA: TIGR02266 family protein [Myxococcales bacterium]|nr:TIGR02266 family protein [Myxococcales bacterium]
MRLRVDYERMNAFFADYTKNISKGGTFIKTARPLPVGTRFLFALAVPALSEPVTLDGEVTWVLAAEEARSEEEPGMGIRFVFASDDQRHEFEALVERMMEESLGRYVTQGLLQRN